MSPLSSVNPALTYEQYFVPAMFAPWARIRLRRAALSPGEYVLDVACGTGIVSREVASRVGSAGRVVGLDVNPTMLEVARAFELPSDLSVDWQQGGRDGPVVHRRKL